MHKQLKTKTLADRMQKGISASVRQVSTADRTAAGMVYTMGGSQREMFYIHKLPTKLESLKNVCRWSLERCNVKISFPDNEYVTYNSLHALTSGNKIFFRAITEAGELSHTELASNNVGSIFLQLSSLSLTRDGRALCNTFIPDSFSCRCI